MSSNNADVLETSTLIFLIVVFVVMMLLFWTEMSEHDCIGDKQCGVRQPEPQPEDSVDEFIDKLSSMVETNSGFIVWRRALIVSIIVGYCVAYFMRGRIPRPAEWLAVGLIIFIGAYFAGSWLCAHFLMPNGRRIQDNLEVLRHRLEPNTKGRSKVKLPKPVVGKISETAVM